MKKLIALLLAAILCLSLAACATSNQQPAQAEQPAAAETPAATDTDASTDAETPADTEAPAAEENVYTVAPRTITDRTLNVAIVPITMNTSYTMTIKGAIQEVADKGWDINVIVQAPSGNTSSITEQGDIMENLIQQGVDAIVLSTESDASMLPYLRDAMKADIPVFMFNMSELDKDNYMYVSSLGYDQYEAGYDIGTWVKDQYGAEAQKIGVLEGYPGVLNTMRMNGFNDAIADNENLQVVASQTANWTREDGTTVTESILTANPDLTILYGPYDEMVLGGLTVIKERALLDQVHVVGFGCTEDGINAIKNGEMAATIDVGEYGTGFDIIDAVYAFCVEGKEVDKIINRACTVYDASNIDTIDMSIYESELVLK